MSSTDVSIGLMLRSSLNFDSNDKRLSCEEEKNDAKFCRKLETMLKWHFGVCKRDLLHPDIMQPEEVRDTTARNSGTQNGGRASATPCTEFWLAVELSGASEVGCGFAARDNSEFRTEKQWKQPAVMHYCKIETEPGSSAFSLGAYNSRGVLLLTLNK